MVTQNETQAWAINLNNKNKAVVKLELQTNG